MHLPSAFPWISEDRLLFTSKPRSCLLVCIFMKYLLFFLVFFFFFVVVVVVVYYNACVRV